MNTNNNNNNNTTKNKLLNSLLNIALVQRSDFHPNNSADERPTEGLPQAYLANTISKAYSLSTNCLVPGNVLGLSSVTRNTVTILLDLKA